MTVVILNHLWQSSLVVVLVGLLTLLFRNNSAGVRHGLWFAASLKFLLPFSLLATLGGMLFTHTVTDTSIKMLAKIEPAAAPFAATPQAAVMAPHLSWALMAGVFWGLGFFTVAVIWLLRAARLSAMVRAATPLALAAPVPVKATSQLLEPGLVGIFRPVILFPQSLAQRLSGAEIDAILAHEICHLRRRDNLLALIHMLVEAIFWFHPLVWFIGARLVEERERACDDSVLDTGEQPLDYAQIILKVCRLTFRSPLPCASGVSGSDLDRRITAIMLRRQVDEVDPNKILLLAGLGLFTLMTPFVLGGLKPAPSMSLVQSITQAFAPLEHVSPLAPKETNAPANKVQRPRHSTALSLQPKSVSAPQIGVDMPVIIVPAPEIAVEDSAPAETDALVCRPPQRLPESRLVGPRVCLPQAAWDRLAAQGLLLLPDGRSVVEDFAKTSMAHPLTCASTGIGASTVTNWNVVCHQ